MQISNNEDSDLLLKKLLECDDNAFKQFYTDTSKRAEIHAFRLLNDLDDAKDVVIESYVKFWYTLTSWNENKQQPEFKNLAHLQNYFYRVIRNACLDFLKSKPQDHLTTEALENIPAENSSEYETEIWMLEVHAVILKALALLKNTKYKKVIELEILEDKSPQEIADILQMKVDTVYKHQSKAWKKIAELAKSFYYLCQAVILIYLVFEYVGKWAIKIILSLIN